MIRKIRTSLSLAVLCTFTGLAVIALVVIHRSLQDLPSVDALEDYVPPLVTKVVDTFGNPIGEFFTERRTNVPLTKIPVDLRSAVMAVEDTDFPNHWGLDLRAILRAAVANMRAGRVVQGGSTLTQQLAKTIFLTRKKTFTRKFKELLLTLQIEHRYSKDEILQLYLNQIYFGAGAYGVEAASRLYFGKHTEELNLAECALLAGLIRSPNRYSPLRHPQRAIARRSVALNRMKERGLITEAENKEADEFPILSVSTDTARRDAPYFLEEVKKKLEPLYGVDQLEQAGLTIQTTLDLKLQRIAEDVMEKHLKAFDVKYATATLEEYNTNLLSGTTEQVEISTVPPNIQGSLIAVDVQTGAILAMVGGRDFFKSQFNRSMQANRQPGSAFKPFVWAAALNSNFTAATIVNDSPLVYIDMDSNPTLLAETTSYAQTELAILDNLQMSATEFMALDKEEAKELMKRYWRPQNYNGKYLGPLTLRKALQKSRNLVSVRIIDSVGPRAVVRIAHQAGIKSHLSPVLSLALGTSVVNLLELTNAFATFARGGLYAEPYFIKKITDRRGKILEENSPKIEARISPQTAFLTVNLLKAVVNGGTGWYARRLRRNLGGKTGTTQDQRDLLFVGFSPEIACGVWVGYDDFRPLKRGLSSSKIAVPLWTDFMREALKGAPKSDFPVPPHIEYAKIDSETGFLALPTCPNVHLEAFRKGTVPTEFCPVIHQP